MKLIEDLDLSVRTYNCLKRALINSLEELQSLPKEEYKNIRNFGQRCAEEVEMVLKREVSK